MDFPLTVDERKCVTMLPVESPRFSYYELHVEDWSSVKFILEWVSVLGIRCKLPSYNDFNELVLVDLTSLLGNNTKRPSGSLLRRVVFEFQHTEAVTRDKVVPVFPLSRSYFGKFSVLENALLACSRSIQTEVISLGHIRIEGETQTLENLLKKVIFRRLHERGQLVVTHLVQCEFQLRF